VRTRLSWSSCAESGGSRWSEGSRSLVQTMRRFLKTLSTLGESCPSPRLRLSSLLTSPLTLADDPKLGARYSIARNDGE
jgi:hypothetical protein